MSERVFVTSDISLAAYFRMRGTKLVIARKTGRRFVFEFEASPEEAKQMRTDFVNSESYQYDHAMRGVKSLLYSDQEGGA